MLDRQFVRANPDLVKAGARKKNMDAPVDEFLRADAEFRAVTHQLGEQRGKLNAVSKSIGGLMGQGKKDEAEGAKAEAKVLSDAIAEGEKTEKDLEQKLREIELRIPNPPHQSVPEGKSDADNVEIRRWGEQPKFDFEPKAHWDVCENLKLVDFERAAKISGSGFAVYTAGARGCSERSSATWWIFTPSTATTKRSIRPSW